MDGLWIAISSAWNTRITSTLNAIRTSSATPYQSCKWVGVTICAQGKGGMNARTQRHHERSQKAGEVVSTRKKSTCSNLLRHDSYAGNNHGTNKMLAQLFFVLVATCLMVCSTSSRTDEAIFKPTKRNHDFWARVKTNA